MRDAVNIDPCEVAVSTCSRNTHERPLMGPLHCIADDNLIFFGKLILKREEEVWKSRAKPCDAFSDAFTTFQSWTRGVMENIAGGDKLLDEGQFAFVPNFLNPASGKGLVCFC